MDTQVAVTSADLSENGSTNGATLIDKGGYTLEYKNFAAGTPAEGFGYFAIQYKDVSVAVEKLGSEAVLAALNSALTSSLRVKAKSRLPEDTDEAVRTENTAKLRTSSGGVLLTESEAEAFVPGSREKTSVATLMREAKEAKANGDIALARQLYARAQEQLKAQMLEAVGSIGEDESAEASKSV